MRRGTKVSLIDWCSNNYDTYWYSTKMKSMSDYIYYINDGIKTRIIVRNGYTEELRDNEWVATERGMNPDNSNLIIYGIKDPWIKRKNIVGGKLL